jgi:hypothetical protein
MKLGGTLRPSTTRDVGPAPLTLAQFPGRCCARTLTGALKPHTKELGVAVPLCSDCNGQQYQDAQHCQEGQQNGSFVVHSSWWMLIAGWSSLHLHCGNSNVRIIKYSNTSFTPKT